MHPFPHVYQVTSVAAAEGDVSVSSSGLPGLTTAAPAEFGGPGNRWSPETLLVAAVADCYILSFRAVAAASKLPWTRLTCAVSGTLERIERVTSFTSFTLHAELEVPSGTDQGRAERTAQKAEQACLISNSLKADTHLELTVRIAD